MGRKVTKDSKSANRRIIFAGVTALLLSVPFVLYSVFRARNDPRLYPPYIEGVRLIPRSEFPGKSWLSLPWFGGKRLTFPTGSAMPAEFKDDPGISGVLTWDGLPGGIGLPTSLGGNAAPITSSFNLAEWRDDRGHRYELTSSPRSWASDFSELPYVYGNEPMSFSVNWQAPSDRPYPMMSLKIELPPNHKSPPSLSTRVAKVGKWHVHFAPEKPLSPGLCVRHVVTVEEAKPGDIFLLDVDIEERAGRHHGLLITDGNKSQMLVPIGKVFTANLKLRKVKKIALDLQYANVKGASGDSQGELVDQKGKTVGIAYYSNGRRVFMIGLKWTDRFSNVSLDGGFQVEHLLEPTVQQVLSSGESRLGPPLREGQALKGSVYETLESAVGKVTF